MDIAVWAYKKLNELKGQLGYVNVEEVLGKKLIANGSVQDPYLGANEMKYEDNVTLISDGILPPTNPTSVLTKPTKPTKPVVTTTTNPTTVDTSDEPEVKKEKKKKNKSKVK